MLTKEKVQDILKDVDYPGLVIIFDQTGRDHLNHRELYLQVIGYCTCKVTGKAFQNNGRKWRISAFMTRSEVVQTALKAVLTYTEHEVRESFKYRGVSIFDPHYNVDELHALRSKGKDALDVREQEAL